MKKGNQMLYSWNHAIASLAFFFAIVVILRALELQQHASEIVHNYSTCEYSKRDNSVYFASRATRAEIERQAYRRMWIYVESGLW